MVRVRDHRQAAKELTRLPEPVRQVFEVVRSGLAESAYPEGMRETIARGRGPTRRVFMIWGTTYQRVTYRMAWEVRRAPPRSGLADEILVWKYGPHEGFYDRLWQRAEP
jgi:hypothetical protein